MYICIYVYVYLCMYICKNACVAHPAATSHTSEGFTCAPRKVFPKGGGSQIPIQAATNNEQTPMRRMYAEIPGTDHSYVCFRIVLKTTSCMGARLRYPTTPTPRPLPAWYVLMMLSYLTHSKITSCMVCCDYATLPDPHQDHFLHGKLRLRNPPDR